jgi:hypothetical protein
LDRSFIIQIEVFMHRYEVYSVVDGERDYQDRKWGTIDERPKQVGSWLTLMRAILTEAEMEWAHTNGDHTALEEIRKLAATAVSCMEQHGAPLRMNDPVPQPIIDWTVKAHA